jgi:hypothetical protein
MPLDASSDIAIAHELCHALEDQHFDLAALMERADGKLNEDAEFAMRCLCEGSATQLMTEYMMHAAVSPLELLEGQMEMMGQASSMPQVPLVMLRELTLPYTVGQKLVARIQKDGGWRAVDRAFASLPQSSEQALHPERYGKDAPTVLALPDLLPLLGERWELVWENTLGEMRWAALVDTYEGARESFLSAQLASGTNRIATGWDGDRYAIYTNDAGVIALVVVSVWDSERDAREVLDFLAGRALGHRHGRTEVVEEVPSHGTTRQIGRRQLRVERSGNRVVWVEGLGPRTTDDLVTLLFQCREE